MGLSGRKLSLLRLRIKHNVTSCQRDFCPASNVITSTPCITDTMKYSGSFIIAEIKMDLELTDDDDSLLTSSPTPAPSFVGTCSPK